MRRLHLFEFEDQPWFPSFLRNAMTDFLSFLGEQIHAPLHPFVARLHEVLAHRGERRLVDLCSGGGGPAATIARLLRDRHDFAVKVTLTDLYPSLARFQHVQDRAGGIVDFFSKPVDATRVQSDLGGFRLLCNGFHHFRPDSARAILRDAVEQRQGIAVFEVFERSWAGLVQAFFSVGMLLLATPFIRPLRFSRIFFTYVVPAVPLFLLWDGLVSVLRIYSPAELRELVDSLSQHKNAPDYEWELGQSRVPLSFLRTTYLIGYPRHRKAEIARLDRE